MPDWYMITNRKWNGRRGRYDNEPQSHGGLDFLCSTRNKPKSAKGFQRINVREFAKKLIEELRILANHNGENRRPVLACYIHGFNNDFDDALEEYVQLWDSITRVRKPKEENGFYGIIVGFTWPSEGSKLGYLEDRDDARESVSAFLHMMHILRAVADANTQPTLGGNRSLSADNVLNGCPADVVILAHSMGNYVLREGLHYFAKHEGYPRGSTLVKQTLMLAPDISYTSFNPGGKGQSISDYSYRVTVYYSHLDDVLGLSTWAKHFGNRRLGRQGPKDTNTMLPDVVALDCQHFADNKHAKKHRTSVHGSYRFVDEILGDIVDTMHGVDRVAIPGRKLHPSRLRNSDMRNSLLLVGRNQS